MHKHKIKTLQLLYPNISSTSVDGSFAAGQVPFFATDWLFLLFFFFFSRTDNFFSPSNAVCVREIKFPHRGCMICKASWLSEQNPKSPRCTDTVYDVVNYMCFSIFLAELNKLRIADESGSSNTLKTIGLTTNAIVLSKRIDVLKEAGLDSINISLDTLNPIRFELIARRNGFHMVMKGIKAAIDAQFSPVKVMENYLQWHRPVCVVG